jgi:hypothetical protein
MNASSDRVRFERYRLMVISSWPESQVKQAALDSARAALDGELAFLESTSSAEHAAFPDVAA